MNDMIERYIYDVTRRLPESERSEVKRELEASITDMLPENPSEQDIANVLTKLGAPRILAEQYRQKPRYLISPAMYDSYISALKTVTLIVALVCACAGALLEIFTASGNVIDSVGRLFGQAISFAVEGGLQAAAWVTIGFIIADRSGAYPKKPWSVKDLPRMPDQSGVKISRSSSIVGMFMSVFFTGMIMYMMISGQWVLVAAKGSVIIVPFSQAALDRGIPYILLLGMLALAVKGFKLFWGRWNIPLCVINAAHNMAWVSIIIYMLHWPDLFSAEFLELAGRTFTADADILKYISSGGTVSVISAILILIAVIDTAVAGWYTWKGLQKSAT